MRAWAFRLRYPLLLFLVCNAVLAGAYLWSRGGQTTKMRVVANGPVFEAYVDGKLQSKQRIDEAPSHGGIVLAVEDTRKVPSLPKPRGIDRVRVTEIRSGRVLFEDDFDDGLRPPWKLAAGRAVVDHGVIDLQGDGSILLGAETWDDVVVEAEFRNVTGATVVVRAETATTGVAYATRPFRQYDSNMAYLREGSVVAGFTGGRAFPSTEQTLRSMLAMVLRPYPTLFLLLLACLAVVAVVQFADALWAGRKVSFTRAIVLLPAAAAVLSIAGFGVTSFLMTKYTERMPHVQDDVSYVFQAKILASGHLSAPAPQVIEVFDIANPPFVVAVDGKWASVYPFGHPLALAVGEVFGSAWVIPPLLGSATIFLTFLIGRRMYGEATGLVAALLLAASPFFFMTASNFMSHATSTFYLVLSFCFLISNGKRPWLHGAGAGVFYGLLFNTQSLSAVALIAPFGVYLVWQLVPKERRMPAVQRIAGFVLGGGALLGAYMLYNIATRSDPLLTGNAAAGFASSVGFGGEHNVNLGIINEQIQMTFLLLVLNGWPTWIGLVFILALLALATRNAWDYFLLTCAVSLIGAYAYFIGHGTMYGPRYWYPAAPFLMLLSARGAHHAADVIAGAAGAVRKLATGTDRTPRWAARLAVYCVIAALIGSSISSWLLSRHIGWNADFVPDRAVVLQSFNGADARLINVLEDANLKNALVLVDECPTWQCYGTVFWLNSPKLDGDMVIARNIPSRLPELLKAYPDRRVYVASYTPPGIAPFGFSAQSAFNVPLDRLPTPPRATEVRLPSPTPTITPEGGANTAERDRRRQADLALVHRALTDYKRAHGSYPSTGGSLQSLCRYPADAGCVLAEQLGAVPRDPDPGRSYYFASDGLTFLLAASMEGESDASACPLPLPGDGSRVPHPYCVQG